MTATRPGVTNAAPFYREVTATRSADFHVTTFAVVAGVIGAALSPAMIAAALAYASGVLLKGLS